MCLGQITQLSAASSRLSTAANLILISWSYVSLPAVSPYYPWQSRILPGAPNVASARKNKRLNQKELLFNSGLKKYDGTLLKRASWCVFSLVFRLT